MQVSKGMSTQRHLMLKSIKMNIKKGRAGHFSKCLLGIAAIVICLFSMSSLSVKKQKVFTASFENVLGTSFDLKTWTNAESTADLAEEIALAEIDRLSAILSAYDKSSEFYQWQLSRNKAVKVSPELFEAMEMFDRWRAITNGGLDPAVGAIVNLWKKAEEANEMPSEKSIEAVKKEIEQQHWVLNNTDQTATHLSTSPLLLNSFIKSYIIEKVTKKIMSIPGITGAVVNIGGDILVMGDHEEHVNIVDPMADAENGLTASAVKLSEKAIATSGNYRRWFSINGHRFSHIVDPRTGRPAEMVVGATVIADKATDAGALATAFNVLAPEQSKQLAAEANAEYQIVLANGNKIESNGWPAFSIPTSTNKVSANIKNVTGMAKDWNKDFEVAINLELMRFEGRTRRPFVAIWVEDKHQKTVRTIALWYNKPRWLPDLKEWYRKNQAEYRPGLKDMNTISSATRPAGAYTIKWDGKNDEGEYVNSDNYTICIELAREHGTYQIIKQEVACKTKAGEYGLEGNAELKGGSIQFRKISKNP